ncbi:hypothetical protein ACQUFY_21715 [Robbsia andropogonis]|uniref:hypothetical protein n=1 Tax=Robbsia andropogonis TaxID=28092 RepID=UPI003D1ACFD4
MSTRKLSMFELVLRPPLQRLQSMRLLREAAPAQSEAKPVAWAVYWGIGKMQLHGVYVEKATADAAAETIKSDTKVVPLYTASRAAPAQSEATPVAWIDPSNLSAMLKQGKEGALRYLTGNPSPGDIPLYTSPSAAPARPVGL